MFTSNRSSSSQHGHCKKKINWEKVGSKVNPFIKNVTEGLRINCRLDEKYYGKYEIIDLPSRDTKKCDTMPVPLAARLGVSWEYATVEPESSNRAPDGAEFTNAKGFFLTTSIDDLLFGDWADDAQEIGSIVVMDTDRFRLDDEKVEFLCEFIYGEIMPMIEAAWDKGPTLADRDDILRQITWPNINRFNMEQLARYEESYLFRRGGTS